MPHNKQIKKDVGQRPAPIIKGVMFLVLINNVQNLHITKRIK